MKTTHFNNVINTPEFKTLEDQALKSFIKFEENTFERKPSKFAIEIFKLSFVSKLANVFDGYILDTDTIENIRISITNDLKLAIAMKVIRDGVNHWLETETIMAGGYVQCLHLRYIVKTNLRKLADKSLVKSIKERITRLNKVEQLKRDIELLNNRLTESIEKSEKLERLTVSEVTEIAIQNYQETYKRIIEMSWSDYQQNKISDDGFQTEQEFNDNKERIKNEEIERKLRHHENDKRITKNQIKTFQKDLKKSEEKLKTLEN